MDKSITGLLAGACTTLSFLPQVIKVIKTQSTKDLSPYMMLIHTTGASLWVAYGVLKEDFIIVGFNLLTTILVSVITLYKLKETITTSTTNLPIQGSTSSSPIPPPDASVYTIPDALGLHELDLLPSQSYHDK